MTFEEWYAGYNPAHKSDKERAEDAWKAAAQPAVQQGEPLAWMDDGNLRAGSEATAYRVVTDATRRGMTASLAASFITPLYAHPAAPASQDAATGLKDGDIAALVNRLRDIAIEYSGTQQLRERIASEIRPRAAGLVGVASQDAEDAARYRLLRCKVAIFGDSFHILNIRPTFVAPDPAVELDAVLDAAREPRPLD